MIWFMATLAQFKPSGCQNITENDDMFLAMSTIDFWWLSDYAAIT